MFTEQNPLSFNCDIYVAESTMAYYEQCASITHRRRGQYRASGKCCVGIVSVNLIFRNHPSLFHLAEGGGGRVNNSWPRSRWANTSWCRRVDEQFMFWEVQVNSSWSGGGMRQQFMVWGWRSTIHGLGKEYGLTVHGLGSRRQLLMVRMGCGSRVPNLGFMVFRRGQQLMVWKGKVSTDHGPPDLRPPAPFPRPWITSPNPLPLKRLFSFVLRTWSVKN